MNNEIAYIDTLVYAGRVKDRNLLKKSSSGGAFTAISDLFLGNGNAVACTAYNYDTHKAEFRLLTTGEERDRARGSMYMQSVSGDIYRKCLNWLKENPDKLLLFVGMGCQADGFRKYAEVMRVRDRVAIADIVCHGSPSPMLWREFIERIEKKYHGKVKYITFKDKRNGWKTPVAAAMVDDCEVSMQEYVNIFYSNCVMRPSCHECPYTKTERKTDLTIGDFWHIEDTLPDFYDPMGNSLFLIHTNRGKEVFDRIAGDLEYRPSTVEACWQTNLERPTEKSPLREQFWTEYHEKGIGFIMKKYGGNSIKARVKSRLKGMWGGIP